jgi:hypothetical protein
MLVRPSIRWLISWSPYHFEYLIKAVVRPLADEYKVEYEEKEMADYRFCHSAIEYEGLV